MEDTAQKLVAFAMLALVLALVVGLLFVVRRSPGGRDSRLTAKLMQVNEALAFTPRPHGFRVHWLAQERETVALYAAIAGRSVLVHYCSYAPQSMARLVLTLPRGPVIETWIEAAIRPTLALGADEPSDPLAIRRGLGPGEPGTGLVIHGPSQVYLVNRRAAALRLMSLLDDPRATGRRSELGPHNVSGSDDTLVLVLDGLADAARIRHACEVACEIAAVLPELRRELPATALDAAVMHLSAQCREMGSSGLYYEVGACSGTFVALEIFGQDALEGLGTFSKSASGLTHRVAHREARLPPHFDTPAVRDALRVLGGVPELVSIDVENARIRFVATPAAAHQPLISAAFGLARALAAI